MKTAEEWIEETTGRPRSMTQQQIERGRIAIAERCGLIKCHHKREVVGAESFKRMGVTPDTMKCLDCGRIRGALIDDSPITICPNYHNSLDAMHEAEKCLRDSHCKNPDFQSEQSEYVVRLMCIVGSISFEEWNWPPLGPSADWIFETSNATASQRFEAFLRTIGKWEE